MLQRLFVIFFIVFSCSSFASENPKGKNIDASNEVTNSFIEGKHYKRLANPLPLASAPVTEFIYFGCKACYQLVPEVANWSFTNKIGVMLVPAHSETTMLDEARMFHTFDQMGVMEKMYELGYVIFQTNKTSLQGKERVDSYLDRHNVDKDRFWSLWNSKLIEGKLRESAALTMQAQIAKTPTFIVHGIYRVDVESLKSVEELFLLLEYLVAKTPSIAPALLKKVE